MRGLRAIAAAGLLIGTGALGAGWASVGSPASAQEATPAQQRLAAIHAGTCEDPVAQAALPLALVQPQMVEEGRPEQASDLRGSRTTGPLLVGNGTVATTLDALLDGEQPYALLVHRNAQETSAGVACGEIGGPVINQQLTLALRPLNDSGFAGVAVLAGQDANVSGLIVLFDDVDAFSGKKSGAVKSGANSGTAKTAKAVRQAGNQGGQSASGGGQGGGASAADRDAQKAARKAARQAERQAARAAQGGSVAPPTDAVVGGVATEQPAEETPETPPAVGTPVGEEPTQPPVAETPAGEEPVEEAAPGEESTDETPIGEIPTPEIETPPVETPEGAESPVETPATSDEAPPAEIPASEVPAAEPAGEAAPSEAGDVGQPAVPAETPTGEGVEEIGQAAEPAAPIADPVDHWQAGEPIGEWRPVGDSAPATTENPAS